MPRTTCRCRRPRALTRTTARTLPVQPLTAVRGRARGDYTARLDPGDPVYLPGGTGEVGVMVAYCDRYFPSIADRICDTLEPAPCICIASRATSRQIAQVMPCASQVGRPFAS